MCYFPTYLTPKHFTTSKKLTVRVSWVQKGGCEWDREITKLGEVVGELVIVDAAGLL